LDTTGKGCHVGLIKDQHCYLLSDHTPQSHAKQLLSLIDKLLVEHQLTPKDLTGIVYTQGPGAFTGIRIGVSVVQGLALALQIPTLGVSSLLALAWQEAQAKLTNTPIVLVAIDARMQQVYWAIYQFFPNAPWQRLQTDSVGLPNPNTLTNYDHVIGDGLSLFLPEICNPLETSADTHLDNNTIDLEHLWQLIVFGLEQNCLSWSLDLALPVYVRPESALISQK
jgi:tRNA threonylcarbamoyladenosine biosynthesis protein TsaB